MHNEHRRDENSLLLVIDVDGQPLGTRCAFCSRLTALSDGDIDGGLDGLFLIVCVLDLEVEFDEFLGVLWPSCHRLNIFTVGIVATLIRPSRSMKNAGGLLRHASEALEGRFRFIFLLLREDEVTHVSRSTDKRRIYFEVGIHEWARIVSDFKVIELTGLFIEVVDNESVVNDLHSDQALWLERYLALEPVDE